MSIFSFDGYRPYLKDYLLKLPKKGHGELTKIAKVLGVHSTLLSLILSGERDLTLEQAFNLALYLELTDIESDFLSLLVQLSRAGNHRYKAKLKHKIEVLRSEANKISNRFEHEKTLTEEQRSVFYSTWLYSAIRLYTSTREKGVTLEEVTQKFSLDRKRTLGILNFLVSTGLLCEESDHYKMGVQRTFIEQGSPHLTKHHSNWRVKAIQKSDHLSDQELMFTSPVSISKQDFGKIRESLAELLKSVSSTVKESTAEDIACLNIDFFWIDKS
jgi:uncharacterized protein (TIGR02147 family)